LLRFFEVSTAVEEERRHADAARSARSVQRRRVAPSVQRLEGGAAVEKERRHLDVTPLAGDVERRRRFGAAAVEEQARCFRVAPEARRVQWCVAALRPTLGVGAAVQEQRRHGDASVHAREDQWRGSLMPPCHYSPRHQFDGGAAVEAQSRRVDVAEDAMPSAVRLCASSSSTATPRSRHCRAASTLFCAQASWRVAAIGVVCGSDTP